MTFRVDQPMQMRVIAHRFRACKPEHQDRYHDECSDCLLIESGVPACTNPEHQGGERPKEGVCPVCDLIEGRFAGVNVKEEAKLVNRVRRLIGG